MQRTQPVRQIRRVERDGQRVAREHDGQILFSPADRRRRQPTVAAHRRRTPSAPARRGPATNATRLIASVSSATPMVRDPPCARQATADGTSGTRHPEVGWCCVLPLLRIPSRPSLPTAAPAPSARRTSAPSDPAFAASANVLAGTSNRGLDISRFRRPGELHVTASRKPVGRRQKTTFSPEISTRMPVSIGSVSSRPAATSHLTDGLGEQTPPR